MLTFDQIKDELNAYLSLYPVLHGQRPLDDTAAAHKWDYAYREDIIEFFNTRFSMPRADAFEWFHLLDDHSYRHTVAKSLAESLLAPTKKKRSRKLKAGILFDQAFLGKLMEHGHYKVKQLAEFLGVSPSVISSGLKGRGVVLGENGSKDLVTNLKVQRDRLDLLIEAAECACKDFAAAGATT
jgi:hypothetical protein